MASRSGADRRSEERWGRSRSRAEPGLIDVPEPLGVIHAPAAARAAVDAGAARWLSGGPSAFTHAMLGDGRIVPAAVVSGALVEPVPSWAGFALYRPIVMGVLNLTPDSFSDGGLHADPVAAAMAMVASGADMIDVGGESTRPGASEVDPHVEQARVLPIVARLVELGAVVSIDTRHAATMAAALDAGARIVNDVSGLDFDPRSAELTRRRGCPVVVMHARGTPETMQDLAQYDDVAREVTRALAERLAALRLAPGQVAVDPGLGFAKTSEQTLALLARLQVLRNLGCPILVGASRKSFIGRLSGAAMPRDRDAGSLAAACAAVLGGAAIVRVHDVAATVQALRVWRGIMQAG